MFAALLCLPGPSIGGPPAAEDVVRIPTVTRLVQSFSRLEAEIITALKRKDQAKLAELMDPNFEMQSSVASENSVPLQEWLKASMDEGASYSYDFSDMAVRDLGQTAIVSFNWKIPVSATNSAPNAFIVDVWKKENTNWKLAIRFASTVRKTGERLPGMLMNTGVIEKKY